MEEGTEILCPHAKICWHVALRHLWRHLGLIYTKKNYCLDVWSSQPILSIKKHVIMSSVVTLPIIFTRVGQGREMRMPLMSHWWPSCITSAKVWPCERQNNMWALNLTITKLVMIMQCKCWVKNKIIRYIWMLHVLF